MQTTIETTYNGPKLLSRTPHDSAEMALREELYADCILNDQPITFLPKEDVPVGEKTTRAQRMTRRVLNTWIDVDSEHSRYSVAIGKGKAYRARAEMIRDAYMAFISH